MRQFAGFGTAAQTNERFKFLLDHGQTGLSVAFDFPTLDGLRLGRTSSRLGEVGQVGVAISSPGGHGDPHGRDPHGQGLDVDDDQRAGADPAGLLHRLRREPGRRPAKLIAGTVQNDILKEYQAQHAWLVPAEPALRMITDVMAYCSEHVPQWNTISISGLPHPRGGFDRGARARLHPGQRLGVRAPRRRSRHRRRRLRAAAVVLLRQPPRLLRGDLQVPRGAPDLGAQDASRSSAPRIRARG